jgi:hypothetical protein
VNLAKEDAIEPVIVKAVLDRNIEKLPESLRDVYRFTESVLGDGLDAAEFRERLRKVFGEEALVELAIAIATCRVFPTLKRALGYSQNCSAATVEVLTMRSATILHSACTGGKFLFHQSTSFFPDHSSSHCL